jgi:hypothetical protein
VSRTPEVPTLHRCVDCRADLPGAAAFCPACGASTATARVTGPPARPLPFPESFGLPGLSPIRPLGRGGTADVHLARQLDLQRLVAVKIIRVGVGDGGSWRAFEREAQLVARLSGHPHVLGVYTAGRSDDGRPFLVMEYLDRGSLEDVLAAEGPLPVGEAARVGRAVADALMAAHELGIVHRDVKPGNVLLGSDGAVKLADFGLARLVAAQAPSTTGSVAFTPEYVAPEILTGGEVGPWTDAYALAATLVKALTGASPHVGGEGEEVHAILVRKLLEDPPTLGPAVPPSLDELLTRTLAVDPAERPSVAQLREGLAGLVAAGDGDVEAAPAGAPSAPGDLTSTTTIPLHDLGQRARLGAVRDRGVTERTRRPAQRRRLRTRTALVALVVLLVAVTGGALALAWVGRTNDDTARPSSAAPSPSPTRDGASPAPPATATGTSTPATASVPEASTTTVASVPSTIDAPARLAPSGPSITGGASDPVVFLREYYATLDTGAYEAAYAMLAPEFDAAGSFQDYVGFWRTVDGVEVLAAEDAATGSGWPRRVELTIRYTTGGRTITERDELTVRPGEDGRLLISGFRVMTTL